MSKTQKSYRGIPVQISGQVATINPNKLTNMRRHSGTAFNGEQVNSMYSQRVGDSVVLKARQTGAAISGTVGEVSILAKDLLEDLGFTVTPPAGSQATA